MKKPVMPSLPWTVQGACVRNGPARVCLAVEYPEGHAADYIAHAANAYPELVAALCAIDRDSKARGTWTATERAAAALLVKLGEQS